MADTPAENGVSITGTVFVFFLLCSQIPAFYNVIRHTKSVEHLSVGPTLGQGSNFVLWVVYGLVQSEAAILRVNAIGVGFTVVYLGIFLVYARGQQWATIVKVAVGSIAACIVVLAPLALTPTLELSAKITAIGSIAVVCNTIMYAAPISQLVRG